MWIQPIALVAQGLKTPDRLEPIPPLGFQASYNQAVHTALIGEKEPLLWMMVEPSFSPEYVVLIDCDWTKKYPPQLLSARLQCVEAKKQIWHWKPKEPGSTQEVLDYLTNPGTDRREIDFPLDATSEIAKAWSHALIETRYPKPEGLVIGADGDFYSFFVNSNALSNLYGKPMYGTVWSPQDGPTAQLANLGEDLIKYVKAQEKDRQAILSRCIAEAKSIQAYEYK